jgi:GAF domain-containing protein
MFLAHLAHRDGVLSALLATAGNVSQQAANALENAPAQEQEDENVEDRGAELVGIGWLMVHWLIPPEAILRIVRLMLVTFL